MSTDQMATTAGLTGTTGQLSAISLAASMRGNKLRRQDDQYSFDVDENGYVYGTSELCAEIGIFHHSLGVITFSVRNEEPMDDEEAEFFGCEHDHLCWQRQLPLGSRVLADRQRLADMAARLDPLLRRIHMSLIVDPADPAKILALTLDGLAVCTEVGWILQEDWTLEDVAVLSAAEWLAPLRGSVVTAQTSGSQLRALARTYDKLCVEQRFVYDLDVYETLERWRDELKAESALGRAGEA